MSRQSRDLMTLSLVANGAVTRYRAVGYNGAQATVAGQKVAGIAWEDAATGRVFPVRSKGTAVVETGGAIAVGDAVAVDASGRAIAASALAVAVPAVEVTSTVETGATPVTSGAANGAGIVTSEATATQGTITGGVLPQYVFGDALQAASGVGEFIEIALR